MNAPRPTRVALVGATGMIGSHLIELAVGRSDMRLIAIARREVDLPKGARMELLVAPTEGFADAVAAVRADVLVCALGTTWRKAGKNKQAFRSIDEDLVLDCALAAKESGVKQMIFVSSVGANPTSKSFYLQVKGEVEAALTKARFARLDIVRPGLMRGAREDRRLGERLAMLASPLADMFLQGPNTRYRSIRGEVVARAILGLTREKMTGRFVSEHDAIVRAASRV